MATKPFNAKLITTTKGHTKPTKKKGLPPGVETAKKALPVKGKKKPVPPEKK